MRTLNIDIETYSPVDLPKAGMHRYAEEVEILLFGYSIDGAEPEYVDLTTKSHLKRRQQLPPDIFNALTDPDVIKIAFNAPFEIACISEYFAIELDLSQWRCTMHHGAYCGLPLKLEQIGKALKLAIQKDGQGMALIRYFCMPCKPTIANGQRTRNLPHHAPDKWRLFILYLLQDVRSEMAVGKAVAWLPVPAFERRLWVLDQKINMRGVKIDLKMVHNAIQMNLEYRQRLIDEAIRISGITSPTSVAQVKRWLEVEEDITIEDLKKASIPHLIKKVTGEKSKRILRIRQELSKTSVTKYKAMLQCKCSDGRIRGLFQIYGANRTGRWAGRLVQMQNLPKSKIRDSLIAAARDMVLAHDAEDMEMTFGSIPDILSQLLRTAFIADEGKRLIVSDFAAIESRVISWFANQEWRLEIFKTHGKIYEATASRMFHVPLEAVTKGSKYRDAGKVCELACGFQGGIDALIAMCISQDIEIPEEEMEPAIKAWRTANPKIVRLWKAMNKAAVLAIKAPTVGGYKIANVLDWDGSRLVDIDYGVRFEYTNNCLLMVLPSGRKLCYYHAKLEEGKYGLKVTYWGLNQTTKQWQKQDTYGGKLTENLVQATARDCLAHALMNIDDAGYDIDAHVHDESVNACDYDFGSLDEINTLMIKPAPWMKNLPMKAEGFINHYYKKEI